MKIKVSVVLKSLDQAIEQMEDVDASKRAIDGLRAFKDSILDFTPTDDLKLSDILAMIAMDSTDSR